MKRYLIFYFLCLYNIPLYSQSVPNLYDQSKVLKLELRFSQPDYWQQLEDNSRGDNDIDIPATLIVDDTEQLNNVGVRFKGHSSLRMGGDKKPFNISIDSFQNNQLLWGYKTINLNNGFKDPTFVREIIGYDIFRKYIPAPKANYARLYINGEYHGIYTSVQQINRGFIGEWFEDTGGNLYKGDPRGNLRWRGSDVSGYDRDYELKTNTKTNDWSGLIKMIDVLNNTPSGQFENEIAKYLNVDEALWYIALCNILVNLDSYIGSGHNHYLYNDPKTGRFHIFPWDLNEVFGAFSYGHSITQLERLSIFYNDQINSADRDRPLIRKLLSVPSYRKRYVAHYRTIVEEVFSEEYLNKEIEGFQNLIRYYVQTDTKKLYTYEEFTQNLTQDMGPGPGGGVPGILKLTNNRRNHLLNTTEFKQPKPAISNIVHNPQEPTINDEVRITARVSPGSGSIRSVKLYYTTNGIFSSKNMYDDGFHNDNIAGDGIYGVSLPKMNSRTIIDYYILAENSSGTVAFSPQRAERETYSYIITGVSNLYSKIVINEFLALNTSTYADPQGQFDDWMELYNNTDSQISLKGMYLTDDPLNTTKWKFPDITIKPYDYMLVWTDGDVDDPLGIHTDFRLSVSGEFIGLYDSDANGNGVIDSLSYGQQKDDVSYGRYPNGSGIFEYLSASTPAAVNSVPTSIPAKKEIPDDFRLYQNYPNPFNPETTIKYVITKISKVKLEIYNISGQKIKTLVNEIKFPGYSEIIWDGTSDSGAKVSSGIYYYKLRVGDFIQVKKMAYIK